MGETVDVIVLGEGDNQIQTFRFRTLVAGGEYGKGKRGGGVSSLLVGVLDDRDPVDSDEPKYIPVIK